MFFCRETEFIAIFAAFRMYDFYEYNTYRYKEPANNQCPDVFGNPCGRALWR